MYKVIVTKAANQDIGNIITYIAGELVSPSAATTFLSELDRCYTHLENTPRIYEACQNKGLQAHGYRRAIVKNYVMIYKIDDHHKTVHILRVLYGARDYERLV